MTLTRLIHVGGARVPPGVQWYSVNSDAAEISRELDDLCDGTKEVVAVEVFDHPDAYHSKQHASMIGPWCLGPEEAVLRHLAERGLSDYTVQYTAGTKGDA